MPSKTPASIPCRSSLGSYTLGSLIENLKASSKALPFNGTGNSLNNVIEGNTVGGTLNGLAGPDTLIGGGGRDVLSGGTRRTCSCTTLSPTPASRR